MEEPREQLYPRIRELRHSSYCTTGLQRKIDSLGRASYTFIEMGKQRLSNVIHSFVITGFGKAAKRSVSTAGADTLPES